MTQLLALKLHVSTWRRHDWHTIFRLRLSEGLSLLILAAIQLLWLQLMLIDWDATLAGIPLELLGLYRPEWLLAANLVACVTFTGVIATRLLRCAGAATAAGLLALAIRVGLIALFDVEFLQFVAWIAALLPLIAIDIWAWYCSAIREREPEWRGTAAAVVAAMALNAFVIRHIYNLSDSDNLTYAAAIVVTGLGMSWLVNKMADAMLRQREATVAATIEGKGINPAVSFGILAAFLAFIFFFIVTASPPV